MKQDHLAGGASRLAALLLPQICPIFSVVAPCHPGAALRDLVLLHRGRATSSIGIRLAVARAVVADTGERSLRMTRITSFVVCIGLLSLGAAPRASAEPIRITGGTFLVPSLSESGSISIVGTRGFSLVSKVATLEGRVDPFTNCIPCSPGVSTISIGAFQGGTSFFGPVTLDGVTYHVGDGIDDPEHIAFEIFGTAPVPSVDSLPTSVTVPFTLAGNFFAPFSEAGVAIEGRGL